MLLLLSIKWNHLPMGGWGWGGERGKWRNLIENRDEDQLRLKDFGLYLKIREAWRFAVVHVVTFDSKTAFSGWNMKNWKWRTEESKLKCCCHLWDELEVMVTSGWTEVTASRNPWLTSRLDLMSVRLWWVNGRGMQGWHEMSYSGGVMNYGGKIKS